MIVLKNVSKTFKSKKIVVEAAKDINLHIEKGKIFGLVGLSGAGKTTLIRLITGLEKPTTGDILIDGTNILDVKSSEERYFKQNIGVVFQGINLLLMQNVYKNIAFPLEINHTKKEDIDKRVKELCSLVGLSEKLYEYPSKLSGGQRQRVAIARALANNPKVLLLDEITSALDPVTTVQILNLLKDINQKLNVTMIVITHDISVVKKICDDVAIMYEGSILESGKVANILDNPQSEFGKLLLKGE